MKQKHLDINLLCDINEFEEYQELLQENKARLNWFLPIMQAKF